MAGPHPSTIVVDAGGLAPDIVTVDALVRLHLAALRLGQRVRLRNATADLRELIAFAGLAEALPADPGGETE
jgi:hypothetical protein